MAREYLLESNFSRDFVERVSIAIAEHGTEFGDLPPAKQGEQFSWEGKVLVEADILDKLGASAVTSGLMYLGKQDKLNFDARKGLLDSSTYERAEFFKDYFWTKTGKEMAKRRFAFFGEYLDRLQEEVVETDMPDMSSFYKQLTPFFHLIYEDWNATIEAHGRMLAHIIDSEWGTSKHKILDVACGIGTQSLALAARGLNVTASDLSPEAVSPEKVLALTERAGFERVHRRDESVAHPAILVGTRKE